MTVDLTGKTAVVTGGSGVLGSAMCRGLARSGAKVAILARGMEKANRLAQSIKQDGGTALAFSCDVLDSQALKHCAEYIAEAFGPCDILLNAAGGNNPRATTLKEWLDEEDKKRIRSSVRNKATGNIRENMASETDAPTFFELDPEGVRSAFDLNFMGTFIPTQIFASQMLEREGATIINMASMGSFAPMTKVPAYCAAKAAIVNFTEWLAVHLAPVGIRVNAIAPGFFLGEQNKRLLQNEDGSLTLRGQKIIARTPAGRFGVPSDLVGTLLWLCDSSASGFITGSVIAVDGGFCAFTGI
jgi:NAD(P)-dependent dehydrogenase (short-subunit alcohol dehydrogenase family)